MGVFERPRLAEIAAHLGEGWRLRRAVWQLIRRRLAAQTRGSILGAGWLVLEPGFLFVLYTLVFGQILNVRFGAEEGVGTFALYLWCGLVPYTALQQAVLSSAEVLPGNRPLLLYTRFPGWLLPLVEVLSGGGGEIIGLGLLILALAWMGKLSPWLVLVPGLVLVRLLLTAGLAWIASVLTVFARDFSQGVRMLMTLGFFATPIIYPPALIPPGWRWLEAVNPFHWLVAAYRAVFLEGAPPPAGFWWLAAAGLLFALLALGFFQRALNRAKDFL